MDPTNSKFRTSRSLNNFTLHLPHTSRCDLVRKGDLVFLYSQGKKVWWKREPISPRSDRLAPISGGWPGHPTWVYSRGVAVVRDVDVQVDFQRGVTLVHPKQGSKREQYLLEECGYTVHDLNGFRYAEKKH